MGGSTDTEGVATCTYTDENATDTENNEDTITVWVDLNGSGTQDPGEVRTVTKTWVADAVLTVENVTATVGGDVEISVTLADQADDAPIEGASLTCEVVDGPNAGVTGSSGDPTDGDGAATCTYTDENAEDGDQDTVLLTATDADDNVLARTTVVVTFEAE